MKALYICHHRTPPAETECLEAVWSQGRSCKTCWVDCYRKGWSKQMCDADNLKRVSEHLANLKNACK